MAQNVFRRVEKKYVLDDAAYRALMLRIRPQLRQDAFFSYPICNIYYDTMDDALVRISIEKPAYKEKLRLRSYGTPKPGDKVFLELKKKYCGTVYKRRAEFTLKEAERYVKTGDHGSRDGQILHELDYFLSFYHPVPKLYLAYDREAYVGQDCTQNELEQASLLLDTLLLGLKSMEASYGEYLSITEREV